MQMAQVTNFQQKQFSLHGLIPKIQRKDPEFILVEEAKCTKILPGVKCSPKGDSYKIGLFETNQKQTGHLLQQLTHSSKGANFCLCAPMKARNFGKTQSKPY